MAQQRPGGVELLTSCRPVCTLGSEPDPQLWRPRSICTGPPPATTGSAPAITTGSLAAMAVCIGCMPSRRTCRPTPGAHQQQRFPCLRLMVVNPTQTLPPTAAAAQPLPEVAPTPVAGVDGCRHHDSICDAHMPPPTSTAADARQIRKVIWGYQDSAGSLQLEQHGPSDGGDQLRQRIASVLSRSSWRCLRMISWPSAESPEFGPRLPVLIDPNGRSGIDGGPIAALRPFCPLGCRSMPGADRSNRCGSHLSRRCPAGDGGLAAGGDGPAERLDPGDPHGHSSQFVSW